MTEHMTFLPLDELSQTPKLLEEIPEKILEVEKPEEPPELLEAESEDDATTERKDNFHRVSKYTNIYTWGVRDRAGEWVTIPRNPDTASMDYRQVPRLAERLTHREALDVFQKHPEAFQLVDGCDAWACLSDEAETFVVKKEKTGVPTPESVSGAGVVADGSGSDETEHPTSTEDPPGDD